MSQMWTRQLHDVFVSWIVKRRYQNVHVSVMCDGNGKFYNTGNVNFLLWSSAGLQLLKSE